MNALVERIERVLAGRFWIPRAVLAAWLLAFLFSVPGFERHPEHAQQLNGFWWRFVELRVANPLTDLARYYPEGSNPAKRTFRLTATGVATATRTGAFGAFAFDYACAYAALHVAAELALLLLGSRAYAFFVTLLLASSYFGSAAFKCQFGWFDSVAFAFLLIAARSPAAGWRALALVAAFFSDERAILVAPATILGGAVARSAARPWRSQVLATTAATAGYALVRGGLTIAFGLKVATAGIDLEKAALHAPRWLASLWSPFEGGWLLIAWGAWTLVRVPGRRRLAALLAVAYFGCYLASCFLVVDVTRSMSYGYVFLFPLLLALRDRASAPVLQRLLLLSAVVSLFLPNLFEWDYLDYEASVFARLVG